MDRPSCPDAILYLFDNGIGTLGDFNFHILCVNFQRISMISSQMACLFLGDYAPIDYGDASMMGLLDIRTKHWNPKCLDVSNVVQA